MATNLAEDFQWTKDLVCSNVPSLACFNVGSTVKLIVEDDLILVYPMIKIFSKTVNSTISPLFVNHHN